MLHCRVFLLVFGDEPCNQCATGGGGGGANDNARTVQSLFHHVCGGGGITVSDPTMPFTAALFPPPTATATVITVIYLGH